LFKALRDKLNIFKRKAKEELESEEPGKAAPKPPEVRQKKEGGFFGKVFSRGKEPPAAPKKGSEPDKDMGDRSELIDESGGFFAKKITEGKLEEVFADLEIALLESDVAQGVVEKIKDYLLEELKGAKVSRSSDLDEVIEDALRRSVRRVLAVGTIDLDKMIALSPKPFVMMFVGVNGTGKTTAIAKIAQYLKDRNISCVLAAGDTFRAGAIEQLNKHAERLDLKLIKHSAGADPAAVAFDAIEHATARRKDVVLLDTAGRMQTNINLMDEMRKIKRVAKPHLIIFVGDALAGNDAVIQASEFDRTVGIDGVILTKIDADAKGGAALSIAYTIGKPILFVGTGQEYKDLQRFDADWMTSRLFEE
jgi:fused signal recognition particle receptor